MASFNPRDVTVSFKDKNGTHRVKLEWSHGGLREAEKNFDKGQRAFDVEVMRQMQPYMQLETGTMINSMIRTSIPGSGEIVVNTPYAYKVWGSKKPIGRPSGPLRGGNYFARMLADKLSYLERFLAKTMGGTYGK